MDSTNILFISDDTNILQRIKDGINITSCDHYFARNSMDATDILKSTVIQVIVADMHLPDMKNLGLLHSIKEKMPNSLAIVLANEKDISMLISSVNKGFTFRFLIKPLDIKELRSTLLQAKEYLLLQKDKAELVTLLKKQKVSLQEALNCQKDLIYKLDLLSLHDNLTGLYNQQQLITVLQKELSASVRYNTEFSCLMLDIDYFSMVNGAYGNKFGDIVLQRLAALIRDAIRSVDIAFRYGGEEFFILLPYTQLEEAEVVGKRILQACYSTPFKYGDISHKITVSIGAVSLTSCQPKSPEDIITSAEIMLKKAKDNGRNRIVS